MSQRQCTHTGLRLTDDFKIGWRIATTDRGPMDPRQRVSGEEPEGWNRYDTPGSTIYISDTRETAFAELLSSYALKFGEHHPLQKDADFMGMSLGEYLQTIEVEWGNHMQPGFVPAHWRDRRGAYQLVHRADGWWVDRSASNQMRRGAVA